MVCRVVYWGCVALVGAAVLGAVLGVLCASRAWEKRALAQEAGAGCPAGMAAPVDSMRLRFKTARVRRFWEREQVVVVRLEGTDLVLEGAEDTLRCSVPALFDRLAWVDSVQALMRQGYHLVKPLHGLRPAPTPLRILAVRRLGEIVNVDSLWWQEYLEALERNLR